MKKKLFILIIMLFCMGLFIPSVDARRGCCSWHGGVSGCDKSTGRIVCNDGTYSPSCTCEKTTKKTTKKKTTKKTTKRTTTTTITKRTTISTTEETSVTTTKMSTQSVVKTTSTTSTNKTQDKQENSDSILGFISVWLISGLGVGVYRLIKEKK